MESSQIICGDQRCLLNGDGYYKFKSAIGSKEEIRKHLGTDDAGIIAQFEKWWDKYKVSLRELGNLLD